MWPFGSQFTKLYKKIKKKSGLDFSDATHGLYAMAVEAGEKENRTETAEFGFVCFHYAFSCAQRDDINTCIIHLYRALNGYERSNTTNDRFYAFITFKFIEFANMVGLRGKAMFPSLHSTGVRRF